MISLCAVIILLCWTLILVLKTYQLWQVAKNLEAERQELRRWKRLSNLRDRYKDKWN